MQNGGGPWAELGEGGGERLLEEGCVTAPALAPRVVTLLLVQLQRLLTSVRTHLLTSGPGGGGRLLAAPWGSPEAAA